MPLCPQITITPVTVTSTGMTTSNTDGVYKLDTASPAFTTVQTQASNAWSAALGKNTVFYQTSAPSTSGRVAGDVWFDTDDGNKMYGFNGTSWVAYQFGTASFLNASVDLSKLADGSVSAAKLIDGAVVAGKIAASAVGTNELAANSIVAGKIAASTITGDKIAAGTITATNIAAGTITTDKLTAGTLTGFTINNGSGTFQVTSGGAVTATSGTIGGFTLASTSLTSAANSSFYIGNNGSWQCASINATSTATTAIYLPNGGITLGSSYSWTSAGNITANKVACNNIGNSTMTIDSTTLYGNSSLYGAGISGRAVQMLGSAGSYQTACTTSTRRNKQQIADTTWNPAALLSLPLQEFKLNSEVEALGDDAPMHFGLMAEDVAELGLEWLIDRDEEGRPDYIYWSERVPQALFGIIQQQAATISALEARITAIEGN